jgi:hypothetical protein
MERPKITKKCGVNRFVKVCPRSIV